MSSASLKCLEQLLWREPSARGVIARKACRPAGGVASLQQPDSGPDMRDPAGVTGVRNTGEGLRGERRWAAWGHSSTQLSTSVRSTLGPLAGPLPGPQGGLGLSPWPTPCSAG